jgi:hypothetical protein
VRQCLKKQTRKKRKIGLYAHMNNKTIKKKKKRKLGLAKWLKW